MPVSYPVVTVICTCFNHELFVEKALQSIINQHYPQLEIFVVDDASTDNSPQIIQSFCQKHPQIQAILHHKNQGICRSFNEAFYQSHGEYIIDFSADDILLPQRISLQVEYLMKTRPQVGVIYSNVMYINNKGGFIKYHFPLKKKVSPPSGDIYCDLLKKSFFAAPSMMIKRGVLEQLGGYDESLAYEDFDFWVRSARDWEYQYQDQVLTIVRIVNNSASSRFNQINNPLLYSAYLVCRKALSLNRTDTENRALQVRIGKYLLRAFFTHQFHLALLFNKLLIKKEKILFFPIVLLTYMQLRVHKLFLHVLKIYNHFNNYP